MAKLKYNVKGVQRGKAPQPKPGLYQAQIVQIDQGRNKADTNDQLCVHFKITKAPKDLKKFVGVKVRTWIQTDNEATEWKFAEFLDAIGATAGGKDKGEVDLDKVVKKKTVVQMKIDGDTYKDEYQARVGTLMALSKDEDEDEEDDEDEDVEAEEDADDEEDDDDGDDEDESDGDDDDEDEEDLDEEDEDEEDADEEEGDDDDEEEEAVDYATMSLDDLRAECKSRGIKATVKKGGEQLKGAKLKKALIGKLEKDDESDDDPFED